MIGIGMSGWGGRGATSQLQKLMKAWTMKGMGISIMGAMGRGEGSELGVQVLPNAREKGF